MKTSLVVRDYIIGWLDGCLVFTLITNLHFPLSFRSIEINSISLMKIRDRPWNIIEVTTFQNLPSVVDEQQRVTFVIGRMQILSRQLIGNAHNKTLAANAKYL